MKILSRQDIGNRFFRYGRGHGMWPNSAALRELIASHEWLRERAEKAEQEVERLRSGATDDGSRHECNL